MGIAMRSLPLLTAVCLLAAFAAPQAKAETSPNADICAAADNSAYSPEQRIADYTEAIRLDPKFSQAWRDRGAAFYFKKDYAKAIENYDEAIRLDPTSARAFTNRGAAYKKQGRNDRAIADESEAIRLDPTMPEYFDNRGLSYAANGE